MPCEHYQEALVDTAASGGEPHGELRAHLGVCAGCRAAFAEEQSLFSSIDTGLHMTANAQVPASLLPRVRARLVEAEPRRRWTQPLIFAAASVAFTFAIFLFAQSRHSRAVLQSKEPLQFPANETPVAKARQSSGAGSEILSSTVNNSQTRGHRTLLRPVASGQPEVLVPPEEREAFARFVATLRERGEVAIALVTPSAHEEGEPASLKPLQIDMLEVKPLEGTESEATGGAENIR
jgi:hypothetical protein